MSFFDVAGLYYIEYTLQNPGESRRHLFSVLGIGNNGWYNRLYTLTGQVIIHLFKRVQPVVPLCIDLVTRIFVPEQPT